MDYVNAVIAYAQGHPMLVLALIFFVYKQWQARQPFPTVAGRRVQSLVAEEQLEAARARPGVIVIDAFALWCPPCRSAAVPYGEMSKLPEFAQVSFFKVNVDEAPDVAASLGVSALPTFVIYNGQDEVKRITGADMAAVKETVLALVQQGASE